jgi:uncharacterized damage-inducible protein DinB
MNEIEQFVQRYDQTMSGEAWYGDPVWKILEGIDAKCAAAASVSAAHTIWQLVMHMAFWERIAAGRFSGPVTPDEAGNFPATPVADKGAWEKTLDDFRDSNREFRDAILLLDPGILDTNTPGGQRSFRYELVGVIEHHIYHAGQIALLKKAYLGANKQNWR